MLTDVTVLQEDISWTMDCAYMARIKNPVVFAVQRILKSSWIACLDYGEPEHVNLLMPFGGRMTIPLPFEASEFLGNWMEGVFKVKGDNGDFNFVPRKKADPFSFKVELPMESVRTLPISMEERSVEVTESDFKHGQRCDPAKSPLSLALSRNLPEGWEARLGYNSIHYWFNGHFSGEVSPIRKSFRKKLDRWLSGKAVWYDDILTFVEVPVPCGK